MIKHYRSQLQWQLTRSSTGVQNWAIKSYCPVCYWGCSDEVYKYCPWGHGEMNPVQEYWNSLIEGI